MRNIINLVKGQKPKLLFNYIYSGFSNYYTDFVFLVT